ncbi:hypothetical protein [Actinomadura sp. B10D3]|uniref:hypothetical protein n=1 Tax=Actinomadura sp. B10D3 TaxID=3153557 RepID=UPI00325F92CF
MGAELAQHLIDTCTREGEVVAEGFTTSDAVLRAAARSGRRAISCVPHPPLARHIATLLRTDLPDRQLSGLLFRPCRPDQMLRGLADHLERVSLVVAAPPPYRLGAVQEPVPRRGHGGCPACLSDTLTGGELRLEGFLLGAWRVLRRGGHLAVITTARHEDGRMVDPAPQIIRQARALGFRYRQHVIALRVPVAGDTLVVQARPHELAQLRDVRSRALPPAATVHADVCLFTKSAAAPSAKPERSAR